MTEKNQGIEEIQRKLEAPFFKEVGGRKYPALRWLPKSAAGANKMICVAYLSGNQVKDRLNEVFGLNGWQFSSRLEADKTRTGTLSVYISGEWISRDGTGTQSNVDKEKGAETDALKRAARNFGVGAYLDNVGHRFIDTKPGRNGKPAPVDKSGRFLYGDQLNNYLNGLSTEQGLIIEILTINPKLWERDDVKKLYNDLAV